MGTTLFLLGDLISTFFYHVSEHVFCKFHSLVDRGKNRSFLHYAVLIRNHLVVLDSFASALPDFLSISVL